jgi:hypothetical protein
MQMFAVNFIPLSGSLYMFRAFYTPIIRSTILTVSTASGKNHSIVSATFFQRGLQATLEEGCRPPAGNVVGALYQKL